MGCFVVKEQKNESQLYPGSVPCSVRGSFKAAQLFVGNISRAITTIDEFRLSHSDFIGQKRGMIHKDYTLLDPPIGKGAYGEVRRAIHKKTNLTRAVKIIFKQSTSPEDQERLTNEVNMLKTLDHPNIMKVLEFYQDDDCFYIISEYLNGGELFEKIIQMGHFGEKKAAKTIKQIVSAVQYCHKHNIVHRDLKPENILFESKKDNSPVKVIDFGTSRYYDQKTQMKQKFGTPFYIAPEVIKRNYNEKCDIWSCGVILYIMLSGFPPFNAATEKEIMDEVLKGEYNFNDPIWAEVSDAAQNLIRNMMEYDPVKRYTAEQVLSDPWLKTVLEDSVDKSIAVSALSQMSHFKTDRKLQDAIWLFLVSYMAPKEERDHMIDIFNSLDLNGDGQLSREELIIAYRDIMGSPNPETEVDAIFKAVDSNNSGTIEYTEYMMATIDKHNMLGKEKLDAAFKLIDKDGNGYLELNEIQEILNPGNQIDIEDEIWASVIKEVDHDGDGRISYSEFVDMMVKLLEG